MRRLCVGAAKASRGNGADRRCRSGSLCRPGFRENRLTGHALLQQQFGRLHPWVGVEPLDEDVVEKDIGHRDQRHALMVREERSDDFRSDVPGRRAGIGRGCRRPVVDRLIEAERAVEPLSSQLDEVRYRARGINETCERCGVGRNDEIVGEPAFEPKTGNAKRLVLVVSRPVGERVRRL